MLFRSLGETDIREARASSTTGKYDVVPANRELAGAEIELVEIEHRETRLKTALASIEAEYDYVLIDCPPSLNLLTVNALCAAQAVLIPMQCEYYALEGLSDLVQTVKKVRSHLNPQLEIEGLLRTMYDPRNMLAKQVSAQLQQHFGNKVYRTVIPRNVRVSEAPSHGKPVLLYDLKCPGSRAYMMLASEMIKREFPSTDAVKKAAGA